ncbi:hypothetical protein [Bacillus sp. MRMR6]|uniref:hypothetical protein n=1 Tax=Bacillus sp. MRMR6 TaxID=1928617 RepID=UPI0009517C7A|nr:hypothetical protein [Bacillus sp. MRMR6]OLS40753.1 hypothetical protein BTR25_07625 [Bacillus sp. MRMR6]
MLRTFQEHNISDYIVIKRSVELLKDPSNVGVKEKWYERFPQASHSMYVPSCWNNELNMYDYEGVAWFKNDAAPKRSIVVKVLL